MTDTVLKFRGEQEGGVGVRKASLARVMRERLRLILLVVVPLLALLAGLAFYLAGGRVVSTDNAYVGARKVLVTPDISGKVSSVRVREGEQVAATGRKKRDGQKRSQGDYSHGSLMIR